VECGVSAGYFEMLSIPCLRGRLFTTQDELNDAQIAVVNESYANNYFPGENAIGQMIKIEDEKKTLQVVGIVRNTRSELRFPAGPVIYVPYNSAYKGNGFLIKMMPGNKDPASWLKSQLASVNRGFPVSASKLEQRLGRSISDEAFYTLILGIFAAIGMILTMVGIAGLSMQNVARRRHEIGVRLALGAEPPQVVALVIRQIVIPVVLGLAIGIAAASALTRMLANLLFDIKPRDPATFFIVSVLMLSVSLVAGYLPARRASRIDPLETLRCD
jgi:putative ABC transport system permease protein